MRTLAITQNLTLDGRIEMLGDWFDQQQQGAPDQADMLAEQHRQAAANDALLLGRHTFLAFRGYWRDLTDDSTGIADHLNTIDKYVVSSTLTEPDWSGTTVVAEDPVAAVHRLKQEPGGHIVCTGSIQLTHRLIEAGLVDEYRLFTYPVAQGAGRRLFPEGHSTSGLRVAEATAFGSGVGYQRWVAA
ncbi:dihydrofolate reductase family protein [Nocardioides coralli]|uniref:dihydrofolate reductase family protein n=1 Tax=Nocardioides coralli TaxID=2872154 RepID=UPI001CA40A98|nr:dihydrofolate reductase family protein [Nocardioides coralli]QZY29081.1 dihydrofolate reductase family protein [Nocardioides coralli]